jgi:hypothetical protein
MTPSVNVLPYAPSSGTVGSLLERWHAVYADEVYTLDGDRGTQPLSNIYARLEDVNAQNQLNSNSFTNIDADLANLRALIATKADINHGIHLPALQPTAVNMFLRSDNTWGQIDAQVIDAPRRDGTGAYGTWPVDISGNAATATRAERDGAGQVIAQSYIKNLTYAADGKLVATRGNDTTFSIYRKITPAEIGAPDLVGTGATGTWNINVTGNAATATLATTATTANNLKVTTKNDIKAFVVGVNGTAPYVDSNVYLTTVAGQLHTGSIDTGPITASGDVTMNNATLNGGVLTMKYSTSSSTLRMSSSSEVTCSVNFRASKVYNAVWNDYAEFFEQGDGAAEPGDIIARLPGPVERYGRAMSQDMVVGVYSDEFAQVIGGLPAEDGKTTMETNEGKFIPVAMVGRVRVKVRGEAHVGQWIVPSDEPGVGVAVDQWSPNTVGRVVVDKLDDGVDRVRVLVK